MRGAALLLLVLLLAGCTSRSPPTSASPPVPAETCIRMRLLPERDVVPANEGVVVHVELVNCGDADFGRPLDRCRESNVSVVVGERRFPLQPSCASPELAWFGVPAHDVTVEDFTWDRTLDTATAPEGAYCLEASAPEGGLRSGRITLTSNATAPPQRTLEMGAQSGLHERTRAVITDQVAWSALWTRHASDAYPPDLAPPPRVDFSRERVVAAWDEERPTTGYALRVTDVRKEADRVVVQVTAYAPASGAGVLMALTQPHHVVAIPADARPVVFEERSVVGPPPGCLSALPSSG